MMRKFFEGNVFLTFYCRFFVKGHVRANVPNGDVGMVLLLQIEVQI